MEQRAPRTPAPIHAAACKGRAERSLRNTVLRTLGRPKPRQVLCNGADNEEGQRHVGIRLHCVRPLGDVHGRVRHLQADRLLLHGALGYDLPLLRRSYWARQRPENHHLGSRVQGALDKFPHLLRSTPEGEGVVRKDAHCNGRARTQQHARCIQCGARGCAWNKDGTGGKLPQRTDGQTCGLLHTLRA